MLKKIGGHVTILLLLLSCRKEETVPAFYSKTQVAHYSIYSVKYKNDTVGYCCGGTKNKTGVIWQTTNGGKDWFAIYEKKDTCLYDILIADDTTLIACGQYLSVFFCDLKSKTSFVYKYTFDLIPAYQVSLRSISVNNKGDVVIAGGESYDRGGLLKFVNSRKLWSFWGFDHEMRSCKVF